MDNPDLYQECNIIQKRDALSSLEKYASTLKWNKNNNRIIDLGCGDGSVTNILKKFLPTDYKLIGCDISENMVLFASKYHSNKQTSFTVMDIAGDLHEGMKESFDHVFSFYALNWIPDQKRAFENILNLLESDGECFLIFAGYHAIHDVYRILSRNNKWSTYMTNVEKFISPYHDSETPNTVIIKQMEIVGFVDCNVECKDMIFTYDNKDIMRKHTLAVNPFKIPEDMHDAFIEDYIQALKDIEMHRNTNSNNSSNGLTLYYKLIIVYGRKPSASKY